MLSFSLPHSPADLEISYKMGEIFGFNNYVPNLVEVTAKQYGADYIITEEQEEPISNACFKHFDSLSLDQQRSEIASNQ